MVKISRTNVNDINFQKLINQLDDDLAQKNGENNSFFKQFNHVDQINHVIVIYKNEIAVACGAFKIFNKNTVEIKRMFTRPENQKQGLAQTILNELINWAKEEKYTSAILETGIQMKDAIILYERYGFEIIPNYPPYEQEKSSICFKITI